MIGHGAHGLGEAAFVARTYSDDVTLLTLGRRLELDPEQRETAERHRIKVVEEPVAALEVRGDRIAAVRTGGGAEHRTGLALALGAEHDAQGALIVDDHNQTTVKGLYAAGAVVRGLDQIGGHGPRGGRGHRHPQPLRAAHGGGAGRRRRGTAGLIPRRGRVPAVAGTLSKGAIPAGAP